MWRGHRRFCQSWATVTRAVTTLLLSVVMVSMMLLAASPSLAQTPTPAVQGYRGSAQVQSYQGAFSDLANEVDIFWGNTFAGAGASYVSPAIVVVEQPMQTACGPITPVPNAFYCPFDQTIYLIPQFLTDLDRQFGDYAPMAVFAHEWGHHVQQVLGLVKASPKEFELQADCLMGVFTRYADDSGLLDEGDYIEAIRTSEEYGDPPFFPEDHPQAHGSAEERIKALTKGYGGGPTVGCGLDLGAGVAVTPFPTRTVEQIPQPPSNQILYLPTVLPLNYAQCFRTDGDGSFTFDQMVGRLGDSVDARRRMEVWGWQSSIYRQFGCDQPPLGHAGWIEVTLHRFATDLAARQAADYFAEQRIAGTWLTYAEPPAIGDYVTAVTGPATNGDEYTLYMSVGQTLARITGVSPSGVPVEDVMVVARSVIEGGGTGGGVPPQETIFTPAVPAAAYLPDSPAVNHVECFSTYDRGEYAYQDILDALSPQKLNRAQSDSLGWTDGAYAVFICDQTPFGRASYLDVTIHQFRDDSAARQALPYVSDIYVPGDNESRACDVAGRLVICATGQSLTGSPLSDVHFLLNQVMSGAP